MTFSSPLLAQITTAQKLGTNTEAKQSTVFCLINCASEIDKCVDAKILYLCAGLFPDKKDPEKVKMNDTEGKPLLCRDQALRLFGGQYREECLKAASGKN